MRNIFKIFTADMKHMFVNTIAFIMAIGMVVVPPLYAWFNIAGSWDPYGNTGNLKVAVANEDSGYTGTLIPVSVNVGNNIVSSLAQNDQLDWIFTDSDGAMEGVRSGEYYAALVIPEDFSNNMLAILSSEYTPSRIEYYVNEKVNSIAPKVTDTGANTVQTTIDQVFAETVTDTLLNVLNEISTVSDDSDGTSAMTNLFNNLRTIQTQLNTAAGTVNALADMNDSLMSILSSASDILGDTKTSVTGALKDLSSAGSDASSLADSLDSVMDDLDQLSSKSEDAYTGFASDFQSKIETASGEASSLSQDFSNYAGETDYILEQLNNIEGNLKDFIQTVENIPVIEESTESGEPGETPVAGITITASSEDPGNLNIEVGLGKNVKDEILASANRADMKVMEAIEKQEKLSSELHEAAAELSDASAGVSDTLSSLNEKITSGAADISGARSDYRQALDKDADSLSSLLKGAKSSADNISSSFSGSILSMQRIADSAHSDLHQMNTALNDSADLLETSSRDLGTLIGTLQSALDGGDVETMKSLLSGDTSLVSLFLSSPVTLKKNAIYPVENYGTGMAPFYSTLAMWVGAVVLVAMMKTTVSGARLEELRRPHLHQLYFGRLLTLIVLGLMQSTLVCLGDLLFLGIQCLRPFCFLLTGWLSSIVYVALMYTLTLSFGEVGKAVAVVLMVMQVAGSGGTYPVEMMPVIFRRLYPLMPFVHSMNAMRECIGGFYNGTYVREMEYLAIFLIPSLLLGLVFRIPFIRLNNYINRQIEDTKLM